MRVPSENPQGAAIAHIPSAAPPRSGTTKIQWAEAVWNPTLGCSVIAPGCKNCYAMRDAYRKKFNPNAKIRAAYEGLTQITNSHPVWTGKVRCLPERLEIPLRKRKPTTYFVDSMSDLFHADVPDEFIDRVVHAMQFARQHKYIVLTKRAARMADYWSAFLTSPKLDGFVTRGGVLHSDSQQGWPIADPDRWPLPNVILGVSASDQSTLDAQAPHLLRTPAACRVLSLEPLLDALDVSPYVGARTYNCKCGWHATERDVSPMGKAALCHKCRTFATIHPAVDWVIVGGESGPGARPCNVRWIRDIVRQCREAGVACFVKQLGANVIDSSHGVIYCAEKPPCNAVPLKDRKGGDMAEWPEDLRVREMPEVLRP